MEFAFSVLSFRDDVLMFLLDADTAPFSFSRFMELKVVTVVLNHDSVFQPIFPFCLDFPLPIEVDPLPVAIRQVAPCFPKVSPVSPLLLFEVGFALFHLLLKHFHPSLEAEDLPVELVLHQGECPDSFSRNALDLLFFGGTFLLKNLDEGSSLLNLLDFHYNTFDLTFFNFLNFITKLATFFFLAIRRISNVLHPNRCGRVSFLFLNAYDSLNCPDFFLIGKESSLEIFFPLWMTVC